MKTNKIGIFSGTFDPIHIGHVEACLVARGALELEEVLVMIEKKPHRKTGVTSYKHRKKMAELALEDFSSINFFELRSNNITFDEATKELKKHFPTKQFVMIVGSDMLSDMQAWPGFDGWTKKEAIAGVLRDNKDKAKSEKMMTKLEKQYPDAKISLLPAVWSPISSSKVRADIKKTKHSDVVHRRVLDYIRQHDLYASDASK